MSNNTAQNLIPTTIIPCDKYTGKFVRKILIRPRLHHQQNTTSNNM
ncbi:hypothetical protein [Nonlabens ulvanivorans]